MACERVASPARQQQRRRAVQRGVPDALDPLDRHGREQADGDGVAGRRPRWRSRRRGRPARPGRRSRRGGAAGCAGRTALAALAWASRLASEREKRDCPAPARRSARRGRRGSGPSVFIHSRRRSSARMSTRPEPQIPVGVAAPMVRNVNPSPSRRTDSIAPSAPGMPNRSSPPSNAGPAGHDAARTRVPSVTTTSVFVPMSTSIRTPLPAAEVDRDEVGGDVARRRGWR